MKGDSTFESGRAVGRLEALEEARDAIGKLMEHQKAGRRLGGLTDAMQIILGLLDRTEVP